MHDSEGSMKGRRVLVLAEEMYEAQCGRRLT